MSDTPFPISEEERKRRERARDRVAGVIINQMIRDERLRELGIPSSEPFHDLTIDLEHGYLEEEIPETWKCPKCGGSFCEYVRAHGPQRRRIGR
jgi:hypothetical protein